MSEIYDRQITLFGEEKQEKLGDSLVLVLGCGALGSQVANNLARAGVNLRIVDRDVVEESNLHRTLFSQEDLGEAKAEAMKRILERSCEAAVEAVVDDFNTFNWKGLVDDVDLIVDCSDNMRTRYLLNKVSLKEEIPWVHGSVIKYEGRSTTFVPGDGPCFRCLYPEEPSPGSLDTCHSAGVFNSATSFIASYQASEALKYLTGIGEINRKLLVADLRKNDLRFLELSKREDCVCSKEEVEIEGGGSTLVQETCEGYQITPKSASVDLREISENYNGDYKEVFVTFNFSGKKVILFDNGRMQVDAKDKKEALSIYSKIVGL